MQNLICLQKKKIARVKTNKKKFSFRHFWYHHNHPHHYFTQEEGLDAAFLVIFIFIIIFFSPGQVGVKLLSQTFPIFPTFSKKSRCPLLITPHAQLEMPN